MIRAGLITSLRRLLQGRSEHLSLYAEAWDRNPYLDFTVPRSATKRPGLALGAFFVSELS